MAVPVKRVRKGSGDQCRIMAPEGEKWDLSPFKALLEDIAAKQETMHQVLTQHIKETAVFQKETEKQINAIKALLVDVIDEVTSD